MAIDLKSLGKKVAKYRTQFKEGIAELATSTGIEQSRLSAIEDGLAEPTGDEVLILADHFRCDYRFFVSNEQVAPFEQTETLYRAHENEFSPSDRRAIQDFLYLCQTEHFLMKDLGKRVESFSVKPRGTFYKDHAEKGAASLRTALGYPIHQVPADVYADFRRVGVHVFRRKLGNSNISGLFIAHPTAGRCALINYSEDIYRQRFSAAHEMAHAIFDADAGASVSFEHAAKDDMVEFRANRFASCFLMPPEVLAKLPQPLSWSDGEVLEWAKKLRVSCQALATALKAAHLIDDTKYGDMRKLRVSRADKIDPELSSDLTEKQRARKQHYLECGLSDFYVNLCFDAHRAGAISVGRLAEALLSSHAETDEIASIFGYQLHGD
jgi:Zn-dependent peptidase ImmA (M78 family)/transcriptional regulator with XRE-family HTH domain